MFRGIQVSILILPNSDAFDSSMALCIDFSHSFCSWGGSSRPAFILYRFYLNLLRSLQGYKNDLVA
jgi:hypothetical protein